MKTLNKIICAAALFCAPLTSMAWGINGHRISGEIASHYLTPKAKAAVKAILGDESIAMASNWADFIKSDDNYRYLYNWHFIDFDKVYTQAEMKAYLEKDTEVDAYTKLNFLVAELKKKTTTKENKLLYLRMVIHIVEDMHQPLHTGHTGDKGGNDIKLSWFGKPTNLHSVWDSELIDLQQLSYTEYTAAIDHPTPAQVTEWEKAPIDQWLYESNQLAEKIYSEAKPDSNLSYRYNFNNLATVNQQLLKGGVRLAGLLNSIFG